MLFRNNYSVPRRFPRHWWNHSVEVLSGSGRLKALGVNISNGGMCLFTVANLRVGSQIELEFSPPGSSDPVRYRAEVRHRALYLYGIEFLQSEMSSGDRRQPPERTTARTKILKDLS